MAERSNSTTASETPQSSLFRNARIWFASGDGQSAFEHPDSESGDALAPVWTLPSSQLAAAYPSMKKGLATIR